MFVKPKDGVQVLDPHTRRPVPADGADVPETAYWLRRVRDRDLVEAEPTAAEPEPATAAPAAEHQ